MARLIIPVLLIVIVLLAVSLFYSYRQRQSTPVDIEEDTETSDVSLVIAALTFSALVGTLVVLVTMVVLDM